jgi:VWFA-related protein
MGRVAMCFGVALGGAVLSAQAPQTPTFRSTTSLVVVDVSVLDQNGRPVSGLGPDDFEVKLNGQVRPVTAVTYEAVAAKAAPLVAAPTSVAVPAVTNAKPAGDPRVFVVMVDDLSITPARGKSLFFAAARFVTGLAASDAVGLTTSSRTTMVNPTFDHAAIATALEHSVGEMVDPTQLPGPAMGLQEAVNIAASDQQALAAVIARDCGGDAVLTVDEKTCGEQVAQKARTVGGVAQNTTGRQLQSYLDMINALHVVPGLKQLVILTDGMALATHPDSSVLLDPLAKAAATAGVQLSVLSSEPDGVDLSQNADNLHGTDKLADGRALRSSVQTIAEMTGGTYYNVIGLADATLARVALASSALYQLGVSPAEGVTPGRDYTLAVRVNRPGVTVRANRRAVAPTPAAVIPIDTQLTQAIETGALVYGVPLSVGTSRRRGDSPGQVVLDASLDVPGTVRGPLTIAFALGNQKGLVRSGRTTLAAPTAVGDFRATLSLPVAPGVYRLRFAVADGDQKVGSVETNVTAQLNSVGPFLASDLMTRWSGADNIPQFLVLQRIPLAASRLLASLELYPALGVSTPADVRIRFSLLSSDETSVAEREVVPSTASGSLRAEVQLPWQGIPPGTYTLRATVLAAGTPVGSVSAPVIFGPSEMGCSPPASTSLTAPLSLPCVLHPRTSRTADRSARTGVALALAGGQQGRAER